MKDPSEDTIYYTEKDGADLGVDEYYISMFKESVSEPISISRYGVPISGSIFETGDPFGTMKFSRFPKTLVEELIDTIHINTVSESKLLSPREFLGKDIITLSENNETQSSVVEEYLNNEVVIADEEYTGVNRQILSDIFGVSQHLSAVGSVSVDESAVCYITQPPKDYAVFNKNTFGACLFGKDTKEVITVAV